MTQQLVTDLPALLPRDPNSHKGTYGRVLVVAGSLGMTGAAILASSACLRAGAGIVTVATPANALPIVAAGNPCVMTTPLPTTADELVALAKPADIIAIGPGLGRSETTRKLVCDVLPLLRQPVVLDADGLNAIAGVPELLQQRPGPTILTPHLGEFARLLDITKVDEAIEDEVVGPFAEMFRVVLVLKGPATRVSDGLRLYRNTTGNPGMATAGCGDVLTGLIAGLLGQGLDPFDAARLGVYLHGRAGDLACTALGELSLTAADVLAHLPGAIVEYQRRGIGG